MKDRSRLVTLAAIVGLAIALSTIGSDLPHLDGIGESLFWILGAVLVFNLISKGGCCAGRSRSDADSTASASEESVD